MKKCLLANMLFVLITFTMFICPSEEMAQYSFNHTDEPAITSADKIVNSDVITETVQTIIYKYQTEFLFPASDSAHILKGKFVPSEFINHAFFPQQDAGFLCAVHHQSNYLS